MRTSKHILVLRLVFNCHSRFKYMKIFSRNRQIFHLHTADERPYPCPLTVAAKPAAAPEWWTLGRVPVGLTSVNTSLTTEISGRSPTLPSSSSSLWNASLVIPAAVVFGLDLLLLFSLGAPATGWRPSPVKKFEDNNIKLSFDLAY